MSRKPFQKGRKGAHKNNFNVQLESCSNEKTVSDQGNHFNLKTICKWLFDLRRGKPNYSFGNIFLCWSHKTYNREQTRPIFMTNTFSAIKFISFTSVLKWVARNAKSGLFLKTENWPRRYKTFFWANPLPGQYWITPNKVFWNCRICNRTFCS